MSSLFIYWRVQPGREAQAIEAVSAWQAELRVQHPDLQVRLYRKADAISDAVTLMETYLSSPELNTALANTIERASEVALQPWAQGLRHVERFDALS